MQREKKNPVSVASCFTAEFQDIKRSKYISYSNKKVINLEGLFSWNLIYNPKKNKSVFNKYAAADMELTLPFYTVKYSTCGAGNVFYWDDFWS